MAKRSLWAPGSAFQSGGRRFGLFQTLEEAIRVLKIGNNVFRPGLAQTLGARAGSHSHESKSESRRRPDVPDAVANRHHAVKIITPVRNARTRDGGADYRFARDA